MVDEFVNELRALCGSSLRVVAPFGSFDYEFEYFRDDLEETYSHEEIEEVYRQVITEGLSMNKISNILDAGQQEARILVLEEAIVFVFPSDRYEGIFVTVDRQPDVTMPDIIETARASLAIFDEQ